MNLLVRKSKQDHANLWWEPFATSTPLKIVPSNEKIIHQLKLLKQTDSVNFVGNSLKDVFNSDGFQGKTAESKHFVSKKGRRNKLSAYLDLSSSEDDSFECKRPIIRVNSSKKSRSFLKIEELRDEESMNKMAQSVDNCVKMKSIKINKKKSISTSVGLKSNDEQIQYNEKENKSEGIKLNINTNNNSVVSSNTENKVFNESRRSKRSVSSPISNKENKKNDLKSEVNVNEVRNVIKTVPKVSNDISKNEPVEGNKTLKTLKRRDIQATKKCPIKDRKTKLSTKEVNITTANPLNRISLSHQLFSDSREQEFINTLDLTSEEVNEVVKSVSWQKQEEIPHVILPHSSNKNEDFASKGNEDKPERPKRRRQTPKEFWITENESNKHVTNDKVEKITKKTSKKNQNSKVPTKLNDESQGTEKIKNNNPKNVINTTLKSSKTLKRGRRKQSEIQKMEKPNKSNDVVVIDDNKFETGETNFVFSCSKSNVVSNKDAELSALNGQAVTADKTVFKKLNELPFKDNGMGCFAAQCWNINNLKCGILKLLVNSHLKCKTLYSNSHLGGVIIKGILKMKIGDNELHLKEGDMAFVPPLTEWQATNIGECESIFYYWCGRFNS